MLTPKPKKIVLANGVRLILIPSPGVTATVLMLVAAGSEYETKRVSGVSHFLEHMVFKGTERRPKPGMTAEALDALGAEYNAFTGQEATGYWAKAAAPKLPQLLELVTDLHLHPLFDKKEIEKERGVIIEELRMYEDMPMRKVHDIFLELLYGDQPAGWDVGGTVESVKGLKRADFIRYRNAQYVPESTVVAVAGDFDPKIVSAYVRKAFGKLSKKMPPRKKKVKEAANGPAVLLKTKESDQSHLVLGVRTFSMFDPRRYAAEVLANLLGGGMSSRLFHRIREDLGAAYYVRAENSVSLDHGYFAVSAGVNKEKIGEVIPVILEECARLSRDLVGEAELRKTKDHLLGTFLLGLETSDELAGFYGDQELLKGTMFPPEEFARRVEAVTADDLRDLARQIFREQALNLALIGPYKDNKMFEAMLRFPT